MDKKDELEQKAKDIHTSFLSDEQKEKIKLEVEKELDAENRKKIAADYKASLISAAKKKALFADAKAGENADGLVPIYIELPAVSECVRLDGVAYYPGKTYHVKPEVRAVILEVMHRGREHEDTLNGKTAKENMFRKQNQNRIQ
jgi:hypothetical protein